jgi:hypothetical protein
MNAFFQDLGRRVRAQWRAANFSQQRFPELAVRALEETPPAKNVDLSELIREFLREDDQPLQTASGFGQPELVVYEDPRFYIQALFWLEGTTQIHQHEFDGAFHVMAGSSLHSEFAFDKTRPVTAHFRLGNLRLLGTELLETGRTVPIVAGSGHIHSLFHLDMPSVTIVLRTQTAPGTGPQFTYLPPHVAVDPFHADTLNARRLQLLDVMERTGDPAYGDTVVELAGALDFERGFFVLQNCLEGLRACGRWKDAWSAFRARHGRLAAGVDRTLDEIVWRDRVVGLRSRVTDVEHRFLLALLLNVPGKAKILELIGGRYPGKPGKTIMRWAEELTEASEEGTWILDAAFPGKLAVPEEEQPLVFLAALQYFVCGGRPPLPEKSLRALRSAFAGSSLRALVV